MTLRTQRGLSLIELMIAIAIGLGLLAALTTVFVNSSRSQAELTRASQQIENGRFATQTLQDNLWHAGFFGRHIAYVTAAPAALPDPCSTNVDTAVASPTPLQNSLAFGVQGYNAPASVPAALSTCLSSDDFLPGTDILVVRRADSRPVAIGALSAGTLYLQSVAESYNPLTLETMKPVIASGSAPGAFIQASPTTGELGEIRRMHVHIYFVAKCSVPAGGAANCNAGADGGSPIPTLKRVELGAAGTFEVVPLVEGIENLQVEYGIDTVPGGLPANSPYAGDGMPDTYIADPTAAQQSQVVAVRLYLLARATERSANYADDKTYDLGLHGTVAGTGPYKRRVFTTVVRVQNVAGWRER
ncbi:MAG: PilW family protein [Steroidobacteraceae bacterium]